MASLVLSLPHVLVYTDLPFVSLLCGVTTNRVIQAQVLRYLSIIDITAIVGSIPARCNRTIRRLVQYGLFLLCVCVCVTAIISIPSARQGALMVNDKRPDERRVSGSGI